MYYVYYVPDTVLIYSSYPLMNKIALTSWNIRSKAALPNRSIMCIHAVT